MSLRCSFDHEMCNHVRVAVTKVTVAMVSADTVVMAAPAVSSSISSKNMKH